MQYTVGNNSVEYSILTKGDKYPEDLDLVFTVGECEKVVYIEGLSLNEGASADAVAMLKEFCETFHENCIIFVLEPGDAKRNVLIRFILCEAGLCDLSRLIDDSDCKVFTYCSPSSYPVAQKFIDESFSFDLSEMIKFQDDGRLNLLLKRIGEEEAVTLMNTIKEFYALDYKDSNGAQPKKMKV